MNNYTFITSNKNKAKEIKSILGPNIKIQSVDLEEIQSMNIDEVIKAKAISAYEKLKKPVIVEDVSFEIDSLNGLPGPFIKFFMQRLGSEGTVRLLGNSKTDTTVIAAIATFDGVKIKVFKSEVKGTLSKTAKGESGFAFDYIFIPNGYKKTYAQMPPELKNKISHRAKVLKKLKNFLEQE